MPYFDHNATTPLCPAARAAWLDAADQCWANPASPHRAGARARALVEQRREQLARILECAEDRVVFTSGATEAVNTAVAHAAERGGPPGVALVNPTEHSCVLAATARWFAGRHEAIPVDRAGVVQVDALERRLARGGVGLVAVMAANNETGVVQPWREVAGLCRRSGVRVLCDAAQWLGKLPAGGLGGCDYVAGAAHKFGGPKGVGFVTVPAGEAGQGFGLLVGGGHQRGRRAGTEDLAAAAAMVAALADAEANKVWQESVLVVRRERFERTLRAALPGVEIVGAGADRLWNTVLAILPAGESHRWLPKLDRRGFQVSTGAACSSVHGAGSTVLPALGIGADAARRALRFSAGWETTDDDWSALAQALGEIHAEFAAEPG